MSSTRRPLFVARAAPAAGVPSPCISVCTMNARTGLCEGCLRTLDEIAHWSVYDDDEKRTVWAELQRRRAALGEGGPA